MHIVITTFGSTGDVQPLLGLAEELRQHGHEIRWALAPTYEKRICSLGFAFTPIATDAPPQLWTRIGAAQMEQSDPADQTRQYLETVLPVMPQMFRQLREACQGADLVIGPPFQLAARMVSEADGLPYVSIHFSPFGAKSNKAVREVSAPLVNAYRAQEGLPPLEDPLGTDGASPQLALYPVSQHVFRAPAQWPSHHHLTGYFYFDEETWQPDPELVRFVEAGAPPVVISFGSMPNPNPAALTDLVLEAITSVGCRAVLQHGEAGLGRGRTLPEHVYAAGFLPHRWLFPRAACVVHHGGAGTTAATFRAGIPAVVVPHFLDQPIWGEYARALLCASAVINHKELTVERLANAITRALTGNRYQRAASSLGEKIRAENGVATARLLIEKEFGN